MAKKPRKSKQQKIRAEFRKKHETRTRKTNFTRDYQQDQGATDETVSSERISGKGRLTRKRTVIGAEVSEEATGVAVHRDVDLDRCVPGRVLSVHGRTSQVLDASGVQVTCVTRGILKTLSTDQRNVVAAGDRVLFSRDGDQGVIERVEPRRGIIDRTSRGQQHVIVANVDLLLIIASAAEPLLKPNLIDRFLVTAEARELRPLICINKVDLVDPADLQPLAGVYGRMGYDVLLLSAATGLHIERLRGYLQGRESVLVGQSGVGKSSLLNAIEPGLQLKVSHVSSDNQKGRHTTTAARLIPLQNGGYVVDTPGIRQFQLWDVIPEEVAGFFRDIRPLVSSCRFPNCTHIHEADCAVKDAVADARLDVRRYESYVRLFEDPAN